MNEITKKEGYKVWAVREVLFRDLDMLGHMNNVTPLYYFEDARVVYFKRLQADSAGTDWNSILARVECDYVAQAFMGENLVVAAKVASIGRKSFVIEYLISEQETSRVVCRGKSVSVCFHYDKQQTCAVPDSFIERLEQIEGRSIERTK